MILTRYLFEYGDNSHLSCVITLCTPWDMFAVSNALDEFPSKQLYNKYLCENMKDIVLRCVGTCVCQVYVSMCVCVYTYVCTYVCMYVYTQMYAKSEQICVTT